MQYWYTEHMSYFWTRNPKKSICKLGQNVPGTELDIPVPKHICQVGTFTDHYKYNVKINYRYAAMLMYYKQRGVRSLIPWDLSCVQCR